MGIYDREYYRDERPAGIRVSAQWSMVTKLIVINVVVMLLNLFVEGAGDDWLMHQLAASPQSLTQPLLWWQLLTYGFTHSSGISHIFWNMFGLWVFGRDVESHYGPREFLRIYLVTVLLGGIIWAARVCLSVDEAFWNRYSVVGASGAVTAITLLFCIHYPQRTILLMMVLPVPAWAVGMMVILANVFGYFAPPGSQVAYDVHLVGAAFAVLYHLFRWNIGRVLPSGRFSLSWLKPKPRLKLHHPEKQFHDLDSKADLLLEKVNRDGMDSLNARERRTLEEYSRRMRQKHS